MTHEFWTRTGGCEFDRSHGTGTSSPSHWQQVEEQAPKPMGWMMCFFLMTFDPAQKLCVNEYIYVLFYESSIFIWFTNCVLLSDYNSLIPGCLWLLLCFKQHFDTRNLGFYNPIPPRMFLPLDLLSEYRIQHGAIGPLYVTSSYSTWIFCRGVSGFATDCDCNCLFWHMHLYISWYIISFLTLSLLLKYSLFFQVLLY